MPDSKKAEKNTPTDASGNVANQEASVRDAKYPDEKPSEQTVAQVEEIKGE